MMSEYLENVRRMAERGLRMALSSPSPKRSGYIDCFQHILDEYERAEIEIKNAAQLQKDNKAKQEVIDKLVASIKGLTGHNLPTSYFGDDDEVGECPYCSGWNMHHKDDCVAKKAEDLINSKGEDDDLI